MTLRPPGTDLDSSELGQAESGVTSPEFQEWPGTQGTVWNVTRRSWARDNWASGSGEETGRPLCLPISASGCG